MAEGHIPVMSMDGQASDKSPRYLRFADFEIDLKAHEVRRNGHRVRLQNKPFCVLRTLVENAGDVVTREELHQRLWPADTSVAFDTSLNTAINRVRQALGETADNPRFIETLSRRGYRFLASVEAVESPSPQQRADRTARDPGGFKGMIRKFLLPILT